MFEFKEQRQGNMHLTESVWAFFGNDSINKVEHWNVNRSHFNFQVQFLLIARSKT